MTAPTNSQPAFDPPASRRRHGHRRSSSSAGIAGWARTTEIAGAVIAPRRGGRRFGGEEGSASDRRRRRRDQCPQRRLREGWRGGGAPRRDADQGQCRRVQQEPETRLRRDRRGSRPRKMPPTPSTSPTTSCSRAGRRRCRPRSWRRAQALQPEGERPGRAEGPIARARLPAQGGGQGSRRADRSQVARDRADRRRAQGVMDLWKKKLIPFTRVTSLKRDAARLDGERGQLVASKASTGGKIAEVELQIIQVDDDARSKVAEELSEWRQDRGAQRAQDRGRGSAEAYRYPRAPDRPGTPANGSYHGPGDHSGRDDHDDRPGRRCARHRGQGLAHRYRPTAPGSACRVALLGLQSAHDAGDQRHRQMGLGRHHRGRRRAPPTTRCMSAYRMRTWRN